MTPGEGGRREGYDGYDEVRSAAAVELRPSGGVILVTGRDAVSFLHGLLTNDVAALSPGQGCYAACLTAQGRMVSDMHVLRRDHNLLLVVEPDLAAPVASRFDQSIFTEDVRIDDLSADTACLAVHGPGSRDAVVKTLPAAASRARVAEALSRDGTLTIETTAGELVLFAGEWLGQPGVRAVGSPGAIEATRQRLVDAGAPVLGLPALTARRIEAGTPVFGIDMTSDTIPLEAGIESRAISTTKGCYVGQEIIVRILHRAHGRVARKLVGLVGRGDTAAAPGTTVHSQGREVGVVSSAAWSPALGAPIALAMVHRDAFEPGTVVAVGGPEGAPATVRALPLL